MTEDARVARTREVVLDAAAEVLLDVGCERLTIDEIAEKSGVARSTIYRNWGDRSTLIVDVVGRIASMPEPPDTGSLETDLEILAARLSVNLSEGILGRILPSMMSAARADPALMARMNAMAQARFDLALTVFERAVIRGEINHVDLAGRTERFLSPFFMRQVLQGWPLDEDFRARQVAAAVAPQATAKD